MTTRHPRRPFLVASRNDDGLSLAEMVVSIAVVTLVLLSFGAAFLRMGEAQRSAEAADRGTQMVQGQMEKIRKLPYSLVGCYTGDGLTDCPTNASNGELVVNLGAARPLATVGSISPKVNEDVPSGNNKYSVKTVVTEAGNTSTVSSTYYAKRVTVTATWTLSGKVRSVTREWLRSPSPAEVAPPIPGRSAAALPFCSEKYPLCSVDITEGQVLAATAGAPVARPDGIVFTAQMSQPVASAQVAWPKADGSTFTGIMGLDNDGLTLTYKATGPAGPGLIALTGVKPGPNVVTISGTTVAGQIWSVVKVVNWRVPIVAAKNYALSTLTTLADPTRTTPGNFASATGSEPSRNWFCVKSTDSTLLQYTALIVDEKNVDDMDAYTAPKLQATGLSPAPPDWSGNLTATVAEHPTQSVAGYTYTPGFPSTGYVGVKNTTLGSLNTVRWSHGFQPGTAFTGNSSTVTISGVRPGDGAGANVSKRLPIYRVPSASLCDIADTYAPILTGTAVLQNNTLTWTAAYGATSYQVYRVGTATAIYSGTDLTFIDAPRPWGSTAQYYVQAYNASGGAKSNTITLLTVPPAPVLSGTSTDQINNLTWTASTSATSYSLYRLGTATPIYTGTALTFSDVARPWGSTSDYYVTAANASGNSPNSNTLTMVTVPEAPVLSGSALGQTNTLTWTAPFGATTYKLYRVGTATPIYTGGAVTFADTPRPWGGLSDYYVTANNAGGASPNSNTISKRTRPEAPTLTGAATPGNSLANTLTWTASAGTTEYILFRVGTGAPIYTGTALTYTDGGRSWGGTTQYYVVAHNSGGDSANSNTCTIVTVPVRPVLTGIAPGGTNVNSLSWSVSPGSTTYTLYRGAVQIYTGGVLTYTFTDTVAWGSTNSYTVVASNAGGNSLVSNTVTLLTVPGTPVLSGTALGQTNTLTWTAPLGTDSYTLYRAGEATPIYTGTALTFADTGRPWGGTTQYYVSASNATGAGVQSALFTLITVPDAPVLSGTSSSARTVRANLATNPNFESNLGGWT
ncbi:hypothetical protein, partial [Tessaracoccus sp.]